MRTIGGGEVFAAQCEEILRLDKQQLVTIRMFPFSAAALSYNAGSDILFLGEPRVLRYSPSVAIQENVMSASLAVILILISIICGLFFYIITEAQGVGRYRAAAAGSLALVTSCTLEFLVANSVQS